MSMAVDEAFGVADDDVGKVGRIEVVVDHDLGCRGFDQRFFHTVDSARLVVVETEHEVGFVEELCGEFAIACVGYHFFRSRHECETFRNHVGTHHSGLFAYGGEYVPESQRRTHCVAVGSEVACDDYALALFQQLAQFLMLSSLMIRAIIVSANLVIIHELAKKIRGHPGRGTICGCGGWPLSVYDEFSGACRPCRCRLRRAGWRDSGCRIRRDGESARRVRLWCRR